MTHWYDDGYIVAVPFILIAFPAFAWVMICRPIWANKIWGSMIPGGLTPRLSRIWGACTLAGGVLALVEIARHFMS